eukprot:8521919-Ditylum_brightwellii.AAC.1
MCEMCEVIVTTISTIFNTIFFASTTISMTVNTSIETTINTSINSIIIFFCISYVLGHQDQKNKAPTCQQQTKDLKTTSKTHDKPLKWEAVLNIVADDLATAAYYRLK